MHNLFPPQQPDQNTNGSSTKSQNKPTAVKQELNILVQDPKVQVFPLRGFTPTRPQFTLQNPLRIPYSQQNIFVPTQRKRTQTRRTKKLKEIVQRIGALDHKISKLERTQQRINKARRIRRKNCQLSKAFHCHIAGCPRKYQSETALKQHIKNKHISEGIEQEQRHKE